MIRETKVQLSFGLGSSRRTRSLRVLASLGIRLVLGLARSFSGPLLVVSSRLALCSTIFAHFPLLSFSQFYKCKRHVAKIGELSLLVQKHHTKDR